MTTSVDYARETMQLVGQAQSLLELAGSTAAGIQIEDRELCRKVARLMLSIAKDELQNLTAAQS